jgi:hypothetical protein
MIDVSPERHCSKPLSACVIRVVLRFHPQVMASRTKTLLDGYQSVDGNDSGAERNEDNTKSLPRPPRKSARIAAMAKSNDGPSYFDVLSDELVVHIFHMLTGGPDWPAVYDTERWKRWSEAGREEEKQVYLAGRDCCSPDCLRSSSFSFIHSSCSTIAFPLNAALKTARALSPSARMPSVALIFLSAASPK